MWHACKRVIRDGAIRDEYKMVESKMSDAVSARLSRWPKTLEFLRVHRIAKTARVHNKIWRFAEFANLINLLQIG